jgi:tripartite-type tricarboxylate transporter receptor subunit TctC
LAGEIKDISIGGIDMRDRNATLGNVVRSAISMVTLAISCCLASAQIAANFYKSRSMTLIVSSDAGGGFDTYSRALARHITHHIPGMPGIIVQNMPGAGSLTALNYISNIAPRDGSTFSDSDSTMPFYKLLEGANSRFDPLQLNWIGSISKQVGVCIAWHTSAFKTLDDAMIRPMRLAGTGTAGWRVTLPRLFNIVAGTKFEVISGYSTGEVFIAMERGEVDGACATYDTLLATRSEWLEQGKIRILAQFAPEPAAGLEGVPLALDRIKSPEDRAALELILSQQLTGRPYVAPPNVPAERLEALRAGFLATMRDEEFLADARRTRLTIDPLSSDQMKALLDRAYATLPETVMRARELSARAARK